MKNLATAVALAAALCAAPAFAASHKEAPDMKAASGAAGMKSGTAGTGAASGDAGMRSGAAGMGATSGAAGMKSGDAGMGATSGTAGMKSGDAAMGAASGGGRIVGAGANAKVTGKKPPTAQQAKMASCNKEAKAQSLKGDERKTFMKGCLSNKGEAQGDASKMQQNAPKP